MIADMILLWSVGLISVDDKIFLYLDIDLANNLSLNDLQSTLIY